MFARLLAVLYFHVVASQTVGLTIFVENSVVSYPFKGKTLTGKKHLLK